MKNTISSSSGHKQYFNGRTAACISCSQRFDLADLIMHIQEDHTLVDITEGFCEACFFIDSIQTGKKARHKTK